jgi:hypothetical protein
MGKHAKMLAGQNILRARIDLAAYKIEVRRCSFSDGDFIVKQADDVVSVVQA